MIWYLSDNETKIGMTLDTEELERGFVFVDKDTLMDMFLVLTDPTDDYKLKKVVT